MSLLAISSAILLVPIAEDDQRLDSSKTFVSSNAELVLSEDQQGDVLCLDRKRDASICLTRVEWEKAIGLAKTAPKSGPNAFIPQRDINASNTDSFGLASSPSTFRAH